jgi:HAD superfamily hydrolase (TIGR01509 family)
MSLRALIFDVDGTLADTEEVHRQAFNAAFVAHGLSWFWGRRIYCELLKVAGGRERIAHFIDAMDSANGDKADLLARVAAIHAEKTRIYTELVLGGGVQLRHGVRALIEEARRADLKLAIATTTSCANVSALLTQTLGRRALAWFAVIATGEIGVPKKPHPGIYNYTLERLGLAPRTVIAFEDSANGLTAAKGAGLFTVVTPTVWSADENFCAADLLHDGLDQVSLSALIKLRARSIKVGKEAA